MCNFIFIQSILLSHCELNTFFFLFCFFFVFFCRSYKGYLSIFLYLLIIWQNCIGKKGSSSFNKLCLSTACGKGMSFLKHLICFLKSLFLWLKGENNLKSWLFFIFLNAGESLMSWVIFVVGAATCMTKHAGINSNHTKAQWAPAMSDQLCLDTNSPSISPPGSFTSSASTDAGNPTGAADSVDQVSPTMPRAAKNRVSGKLRRSASAISKSSNWALQLPHPPTNPPQECSL